ncbi:biotin/lipoyl-containing protein [Echinicola vietnamensis]|uniref:Acetyl/propionyl-CoA carboxylase, alpha subunit n=1 Tax=Echinicola vietnamensis (strain DSM 17526 / LMG 23754 / KMM 6221) TaxID=926556 RepID=L0FUZ5_ECHVK|nr:biotin/lipoyl-containing protein [Echinicola vietnamensis]AGA76566.1 acetyl/propionyl-CoA carboxylase, alpha subunit [Echinicola vietnamensis DSM 17526]
MYSVTVNEKNFSIEQDGGDFLINGTIMDWEINPIDNRHFQIIKGQKSYVVELVKLDAAKKELTLKINNKSAEVKIQDKFDLLLEKLGMNGQANAKLTSITAPMPGLILEINVQEGDTVEKDQPMVILEAMKMENIIKSPGDGIVKKILVTTGESVEKKQILIQF